MRRNATQRLDGIDPSVLDAAREVAQRAGVPLEDWIASVLPPEEAQPARRRKRGGPDATRTAGAAPAATPELTVSAQEGVQETGVPARNTSAVTAAASEGAVRQAMEPVLASVAAMAQRLDALGRTLEDERRSAREMPSDEAVTDRLEAMERKMSALDAQIAAPRAPARRGRPSVAEMREAVAEVRRRQREIDGGDAGGSQETTEASSTPVLAEQTAAENFPPPETTRSQVALDELQQEADRLRASVDGLATGRDVNALEQAMQALAGDIQRVRAPEDVAAIAAPVELMRVQVARLADEVAEDVHARISGEVERLASRIDGIVLGSAQGAADSDALSGLFREMEEIRLLIAGLAGPERIQSLAQGLQAISGQIAHLQERGAGDEADMAALKPILEEIRTGLRAPDGAQAILGRIDALTDKVERVSLNPVGDLVERLESLGETLRVAPSAGGELVSIHALLHGLSEKVDRVGVAEGRESLDSLERQVVALAERLESQGTDPVAANLDRSMREMLDQIAALRDATPLVAAVERATRDAVSDALESAGPVGTNDLLRIALDEIRAQHAASDQRMHATVLSVHATLERLVGCLGAFDLAGQTQKTPQGKAAQPAPREIADDTALDLQAASAKRPTTTRPPSAPARSADELLEPGAGRPGRELTTTETASPDSSVDIKSTFIAAARRAAQAAQADLSSEAPSAEARFEKAGLRRSPVAATGRNLGRVAQVRAEIEKRRRPLLLGLAAIVLTLGAIQAYRLNASKVAPNGAAPVAETTPVAPETATPALPAEAARPETPDPQTTQAIDPAKPLAPETTAPSRALPKVAGMEGLATDLAGVPAGLAGLRDAALAGDGAAVYELATREADGRGMPRDLALAAKLYEKLASAGYAPAQFKLGSFYEKGNGVTRDLAQARHWYTRAAEQGNVRAMHNLAVVYAENPMATGKPDFASAVAWFRRAAEHGVRDSQYNLGVLYARGLGLGQDLVQSYAWFATAAVQGDEEATKKREEVSGKLSAKDLAAAKAVFGAYKPKAGDPAANETPVPKPPAAAPMTLLGAPPPGAMPAPAPGTVGQAAGAKTRQTGV